MKIQQECSRCHEKFWVTQIKVYALKTRNCPDCKIPCKVADNKIFTCKKCGKIIEKGKNADYGLMPVQIRGTIRKYESVKKMLANDDTLEVDKVFVPEEQVCQRCKNFFSHRNAILRNEEMKKKVKENKDEELTGSFREIPKDQAAMEIKRIVMQKHLGELQEKMKAEKEVKRQELLKKLEKEETKKKAKQDGKTPK